MSLLVEVLVIMSQEILEDLAEEVREIVQIVTTLRGGLEHLDRDILVDLVIMDTMVIIVDLVEVEEVLVDLEGQFLTQGHKMAVQLVEVVDQELTII